MSNQEIAKIFRELSLIFEMKDDTFRARAYERGAFMVESLGKDLVEIYKNEGLEGLEALPQIGKGMAEKIAEYVKTGRMKEYDALRKKMPVDIEELTSVGGVGPKSVKTLYEKLGVKNLKDLERAAKVGKIRKLEGFGEKSEQNILEKIEFVKRSSGRMLLGFVWPRVHTLIEELRNINGVVAVSPAGSLRRMRETIGDIDILVAAEDPEEVMKRFVGMSDVVKVWGEGPTKASVRVKEGFDIDLRVVPKASFGAALQYFTGSKAHNVKLRQIAIDKGLKLNEYGLFRGKKRIAGATEEGVYKALGLECPAPELREDTGEIEIMLCGVSDTPHRYVGYPIPHIAKRLPKIIEYGSLQGDLQVQTNWTDGNNSIEEMAKAAKAVGLKYIAITDHTRSLAMAGGSDEKKLIRQMAEIDKLNERISGIKILKGAEVNIVKDGTLDIRDEVLAKLDVVGVSVHSSFKMSKKDMSERIIRAINNLNVDILFHPTGRLINRRPPYEVDIERVIKEAVKTGTILEINASLERLDLKDEYIRMGVELGAKFVINSDAHNREHYTFLEFGIAQARRGWATANDVLNTLSLEQFLTKLKKSS